MKIVLCGYMGSGKTAVGSLLSNILQIAFIDLDQAIRTKEGKDISTIFQTKGEIYFRKLEKKILQQYLLEPKSQVISLGGGTPCYGDNLDLIKSSEATSIYLKTDVKTLTERLWEEKEARPLIAHYQEKNGLEEFVRKHLFERGFYYQQSDVIVDVTGKSLENIAEEIITKLD